MVNVDHIRLEIQAGHAKRIARNDRIIAVAADGTEIDLSRLVHRTTRHATMGQVEILQLDVMGFEIVQNEELNPA